MAFGRLERAQGAAPMSEINMTPLIDVMLVLVVDKTGQAFLNDKPVATGEMAASLARIAAESPDTEVQLRADETVPYGRVVEVMGLAQKAGLNRIGFVADPRLPARP